jgi:hypothetical protein
MGLRNIKTKSRILGEKSRSSHRLDRAKALPGSTRRVVIDEQNVAAIREQ